MRTVRPAVGLSFVMLALAAPSASAQKIQILPASPIDCGAAAVNQTNTVQVTINNVGNANLLVSNIGDPGAPFSFAGLLNLPAVVPPGAGFALNLAFTPTAPGKFNASFTVASNDPNAPNTVVAVTGSSGNPTITLDAATIIFVPTRLGLTSSPANAVTISNTGFGALVVSGYAFGGADPLDFKLVSSPPTPFTINPGKSQVITVAFAPSALGARGGTLMIQNSDGNAPNKAVALQGNGTQANLSAAPAKIDFGVQNKFNAGAGKPVVVTNAPIADAGDAYITSITFLGAGQSFALSAPPMFPAKVAANGGTVTLNVVAVPLQLGVNTATMHIHYDDPMRPEDVVDLAVTGVGGSIAVTPNFADFGATPVLPPAPAKQTIVVKNVGTADLNITDAQIDDPMQNGAFASPTADDQQQKMRFPIALPPNGTIDYQVTFDPQAAGPFTAALALTTDDAMAKLVKIPLAGVGVITRLVPSETSIKFPATAVHASSPHGLKLTNGGEATVTVQSIALGGVAPQAYQVDQTGPFDLAAGQSADLQVVFAPLAGGAAEAVLTITAANQAPIPVKLSGVGVAPIFGVQPTSADFGEVRVGTPSDPILFGVKNGGATTLTITGITATDPAFTVDTSTTTLDLKSGATTTFQAAFVPSAAGAKSAELRLAIKGIDTPYVIPVKGTGVTIQRPPPGCSATGGPSRAPLGLLLLGGPALALGAALARRRVRR